MSQKSNSEVSISTLHNPPAPSDNVKFEDGHTQLPSDESEQDSDANFDLKPPAPSVSVSNGEALAEQLFSADHLNLIITDRTLHTNFTSFLNTYLPRAKTTLAKYQATQKAKAAIAYANAIAESLAEENASFRPRIPAVLLDRNFEAESLKAREELVSDALPAYITHRLVNVVTECLVKEVTGTNAPIMKELVPGLAEVYCLSDPSAQDNPIVYASDEFYRTTGYGRDYVIGRNCRFLQGPKSDHSSVKRLINALATGNEFNAVELGVVRNPDLNHAVLNQESPQARPTTARRRLGTEEPGGFERSLWPAASLGSSGRLPGVYQNYMLVRPFPSLRITFTSPAMRIPGLVRSHFMDRVGGAQHVREGLLDALTQGVGVTAKISWLTHSKRENWGTTPGKERWVHCTPLVGSDENVGVWMIVMIDKEETSGALRRETPTIPRPILMSPMNSPPSTPIDERISMAPKMTTAQKMSSRTGTQSPRGMPSPKRFHSPMGSKGTRDLESITSDRYGSAKLYARYLREEKLGAEHVRHDSAKGSESLSDDEKTESGVLDF
ncbi:hypothetical protein E2P81_ATG05009 [Venturia nashicola]|uniref:PAS domain-containing protein n=1 Tax=Venturia nashicola TaxID=86259 RepID=A0A4Z1P2Y7_9PEZI|nr:hypothetical protein E6O75_ATG05138 [Venturia nashicola]TLD34844.1 hypothetical protein E2P81_ATG05009 [Venturia nashicola]